MSMKSTRGWANSGAPGAVTEQPKYSLFRSEVAEARRRRVYGEIVLTQPVRTQTLVILICGIVALLAGWVTLGTYSRIETARGLLVTNAPSAKVIAIRPGLLTELLVKEGDLVRAGQKLATVRIEQTNAAGGSPMAESIGTLDAQRGIAAQQVQLAKQRATSERARLFATLAGLRQQRGDLIAQIAIQKDVVQSEQHTFDQLSSILEKGYVSKIEVERRRQGWLAARQELGRLQQQLSALGAEESRSMAELSRVEADSGSEIAAVRNTDQSLMLQRTQIEGERAYTVTAPIAGRVAALQAAPGKTVDAGLPLMVLVPDGSALHADVYAPTRAIGFVKPGQEVRLLYDAFPYQRFGGFTGRVVRISQIVIDPRELSTPLRIEEPVYRIEVAPEKQVVAAFGEKLPLQPGMALTANLILDRRSFLDWLLKPLNAVQKRNREVEK